MIKQGLPKKRTNIKSHLIKMQTARLLQQNPFQLSVPQNAYYANPEIQNYLIGLSLAGCSGEQLRKSYWHRYRFNIPDQQTVRVRFGKYSVNYLEENLNLFFCNQQKLPALSYPSFMKRYLHKIKQQAKNKEKIDIPQKRRKLRKNRKMQRDRGVNRPDGLYLAIDQHNIPYYGETDVELDDDENLAEFLIQDRQKKSTKNFFAFTTLYSFEQGLRQVMGLHMMRRQKKGDSWHREPLGPIIDFLLDPVLDSYEVKGIIGDGDYYNAGVIQYLIEHELDFVIRADFTQALKEKSKKEKLSQVLKDGEAWVHPDKQNIKGRGKKVLKVKLVMVKRGDRIVPLVLPLYSELSGEQALMLYEERFGIESSYREIHRRMGFTTSHLPQYRLALFGTACSILNVLLSYHNQVVSGSGHPKHWKVTLMEIMELMDQFLGGIIVDDAGEMADYEEPDDIDEFLRDMNDEE